MWVWAALWYVTAAVGTDTTESCCPVIDGENYREETLVTEKEFPIASAVDYTTNLLYFRYYDNSEWFSAKLDLRTREINKINELTGECSFSVDQVLQQVHAGCKGDEYKSGAGLYQFDSNVNRFALAGEAGQPVKFVYYNDVLYYSLHNEFLILRTFRKGHSARVQDLMSQVYGLVIDKHKDWVFYNNSGVYRQRRGTGEATKYAGFGLARGVAVDARGTAYVCASKWSGPGIYRLHEQTPNSTKLLDVTSCDSFTFDRDNNIIYSYDYSIVRLLKL